MDRKYIIIALVLILAIILGTAGILISLNSAGGEKPTYVTKLNEADKYLESGDYDRAVIEYRAAIEIDETREEAYIGLSKSYMAIGYVSLAQSILETGYTACRGDNHKIKLMIIEHFPNSNLNLGENASNVDYSTAIDKNKDVFEILKINKAFITTIGTYTYIDYCRTYSNVTSILESGILVVTADGFAGKLQFYDTDKRANVNWASRMPYNDSFPNEVIANKISDVFGTSAFSQGQLAALTETINVYRNGKVINFNAYECKISVTCDDDGNVSADSTVKIVPMRGIEIENDDSSLEPVSVPEETSEGIKEYLLGGKVIDATNGAPVNGVSIRVYYESAGGSSVGTTYSNRDGVYEITLNASGTYYLELEKDGYISENRSVYVAANADEVTCNCAMSPVMEAEEMRFVLTWNDTPQDLDAHLIGSSSDGTNVHIAYYKKNARDSSGNEIANLDKDDTNGNGVETITLKDTQGVYEYIVHDYSEDGAYESTMTYSGAQVKIYRGSSLIETVNITTGIEYKWYVFKIENGRVSVVNTAYSGGVSA